MFPAFLNATLSFLLSQYGVLISCICSFALGFLLGRKYECFSEKAIKARSEFIACCYNYDKFRKHEVQIIYNKKRDKIIEVVCVAKNNKGICTISNKPCEIKEKLMA